MPCVLSCSNCKIRAIPYSTRLVSSLPTNKIAFEITSFFFPHYPHKYISSTYFNIRSFNILSVLKPSSRGFLCKKGRLERFKTCMCSVIKWCALSIAYLAMSDHQLHGSKIKGTGRDWERRNGGGSVNIDWLLDWTIVCVSFYMSNVLGYCSLLLMI